MKEYTYSAVRRKLTKIAMPILNPTFGGIYSKNIERFSEDDLLNEKERVRDFIDQICLETSKVGKDKVIKQTDPIVLCSFFYRYHIAVNIISEMQRMNTNDVLAFKDSESDAMFLRMVLFYIAVGDTLI